MAGYRIPTCDTFCTKEEYANYMEGKAMSLMNVTETMNGEVKENVMSEVNENMDLLSIVKAAEKEVNDILKDAERLEGQGLKDIFGDSAEIEKLAIYNRAGSKAEDKDTYGVILFKESHGHKYFTFVSGKIRDQIQIMITAAGGESALNHLIKEQGLKAMFGKKVITSDDGQHTNVKIWFEK